MTTRRSLAALAGLALPAVARAQPAWPNDKVVEVVVPFPAGGGVEVMTRLIMPLVAQRIPGLRPVVLNRTGAAGQIGMEATFNAAPDGYTLGATTLPAANSIALERPVRFRPLDFTFLANIVEDGNCFYVRQESPIRDVAHLIELARARPGQLTYATTGIGSDDHIFMVGFEAATGIPPMIHIPFAGAAPLIPQMLGGHFDVAAMNVGDCLALKREGKVRCLAQANRTRCKTPCRISPTSFHPSGGWTRRGAAGGRLYTSIGKPTTKWRGRCRPSPARWVWTTCLAVRKFLSLIFSLTIPNC